MKTPLRMFLLCTVLLPVVMGGCTRKKEDIPVSSGTIETPLQKFAGTTLYFYNKGYIERKLEADSICKPLSDTGTISVFPVRLTLYDSLGNTSSIVLADSGKIGSGMQNYFVWGNVSIRTRDSMKVRTERLRWFRERRRVESDTFVRIETKKGDVVAGIGLDANDDFSRFSFKSDVRGEFPDFQNRMETNDTTMF